MPETLTKLAAMWDSPVEEEATTAFRLHWRMMQRDGKRYRELMAEAAPNVPKVIVRRTRIVDVIAASGFDARYLLPRVRQHLWDAGCDVNVRHVCGGCAPHNDPWECLRYPPDQEMKGLRRTLKQSCNGNATHVVVFARRYEGGWWGRPNFKRRNIKVFAVHVGQTLNTALKSLVPYKQGYFCHLKHEKDLQAVVLPALQEFITTC